MDRERYQKLKNLVEQALALSEFERDVFLQSECGDAELLAEARDLLLHYRPDTESGKADPGAMAELPEMIGRKVGPYKILEVIGEGGMGVVYLAGQSAPLRRKVALKVIKMGMDTREVISRFESERQALALMNHANIAKVLDAGATGEGRPFFVMEYIQGIPLNRYCRDNKLGLHARLDLFIQVCRGVQHAHQKGVIHRDLKPGNILVTEVEGEPVPKIIDFGVAKATSHHLAAQTLFTQQGQMIGTPEYMSPEQADPSLVDVDTRSDVYSLGVLLYELLTGYLPLERSEIMRAGFERMALHVQNEIPKKPSTRIDTEAQIGSGSGTIYDRGTSLWIKRIRGDLDWITMKSLEKERDRRYDSPAELAADLDRHLKNQPVEAGPPSRTYRFRKFVKRNKMGVSVALLFVASLVAGVIGTSVGMVKSQRSEAKALAAADRAEGLTLFQIARNEENAANALPYVLGALEKEDRREYRLLAKKILLKHPPSWSLPWVRNAHNPKYVDISPDGKWMAVSWSRDGKFQVYSLDGEEPRVLSDQDGVVHIVKFTSDSRYLITSAGDSTVCLWSLEDDRPLRKWHFPGVVVPFLDMARNRLVVMTVVDDTVTWLAVSLGGNEIEELGTAGKLREAFYEMPIPDLDPTRRWIVQPVADRLVLYELNNLAAGPVRTIGLHGEGLKGVTASPDGRTVVSYDTEGGVAIWDLAASDLEPMRRLKGYVSPIHVSFGPAGRILMVSGFGGMRIWDLTLCEAAEPLDLKSPVVWTFAGAVHPKGDWLITVGTYGTVAAWPLEFEIPLELKISEAGLTALGFSPDGRRLIVGDHDGTVWSLPLDGRTIGEPEILDVQPGFGFNAVHFDDASRWAFLTTCNSTQGSGSVLKVEINSGESTVLEGFTCNIVVDGEGRYIATSADPVHHREFVFFLDTKTGEGRLLDESVGGFTKAGGFTREGRLLVGGPRGVGIWDHGTGEYVSLADDIQEGWLGQDRETVLLVSPEGTLWRQGVDGSTRGKLGFDFPRGGLDIMQVDSTATSPVGFQWTEPIQVFDGETGHKHLFPLSDTYNNAVATDPKKRWIAAAVESEPGVLKLMSRPSGTPLEGIPREEFLAWLQTLTNVRALPENSAEFGYKLDYEGVPDWDDPPGWN